MGSILTLTCNTALLLVALKLHGILDTTPLFGFNSTFLSKPSVRRRPSTRILDRDFLTVTTCAVCEESTVPAFKRSGYI